MSVSKKLEYPCHSRELKKSARLTTQLLFQEVQICQKALKIYYLDENYINYLRKYDNKVAYNKNHLLENVKNRCCDSLNVALCRFDVACLSCNSWYGSLKRVIEPIYWKRNGFGSIFGQKVSRKKIDGLQVQENFHSPFPVKFCDFR